MTPFSEKSILPDRASAERSFRIKAGARLCPKDQSQQCVLQGRLWKSGECLGIFTLLRLVFNTAALRSSVIVICLTFCFHSPVIAQEPAVKFVGVKGIPEGDLKAVLILQFDDLSASSFTPSTADDIEWLIDAHYRKQGFLNATVSSEMSGGYLVVSVNEGVQTVVRELRFDGNHSIPTETLYEYILGVDPEKLHEQKLPYNPPGITEGVERIRGLYGSKGWLDAEIGEIARLSNGAEFVDITLTIREGVHYTFGSIRFTGRTLYPYEELIKAAGITTGADFTPLTVDTAQQSLETFYRGKGHYAAKVTGVADKSTASEGRVPAVFHCEPGEIYRIEGITVKGTDRLDADFLPARFKDLQGEIYNQEKIDERNRELMRTGLFASFRVHTKPAGRNTLRLEIDVSEAKAREFGMELGYGSYDGAIVGLKWSDRNFLGNGRPLSLSLESTQRGLRGELLYRDPWWLESEWGLRARLYSDQREEDGYDRSGAGLRVDFTRKLTSRWEAALYVVGEYASITDPLIDPALIGPPDYTLTAIGLSQTFDFRNDPWSPKSGWIITSAIDLNALDGELAFGRATFRYSRYWSWKKTLLAVGGRVGMILPFGDDGEIPIDLRYFNGGATTVRSYSERDLGPKDRNGYSLGGTFYSVVNIEWDFPIYGDLGGAVFADAGNLRSDHSPSSEEMGYAIGVGLRYNLPIGPIRLDYGYNPSPGEQDEAGAFHISFGMAF